MAGYINPIAAPRSERHLIKYDSEEIKKRASSQYRTHQSATVSKIFRIAEFLTKPVEQGIYWATVAARKGEGPGKNRGAGGVHKRYAVLKAIGWFCLDIVILPVIIVGIIFKAFILRPGRGSDVVRFMDATKGKLKNYQPPKLDANETLHLASYNIAGLPPLVDAIKDVLPSKKRMEEFAHWIKNQEEKDLPLVFGLQEAYDQGASEILSTEIMELYPYAVTSAGWASIPLIGGNSGLQFHSRVPITSAAFYPFDDLDGLGMKISNRGFLRVEIDLGNSKSALIYSTHTQAHSDLKHQQIRKNELELIQQQMRYDRYQDSLKGIDRGGHYYLMGDLNVSNVDDENMFNESKGFIGEYDALRKDGQVLSPQSFYDPYLVEHEVEGKRKGGSAYFLEKDVKNRERKENSWEEIVEPEGSFYVGPDQINRTRRAYGTKYFYKSPHRTVANCRLDYVLRLVCAQDYKDPTKAAQDMQIKGMAELRHALPSRIKTSGISDHLPISAIFKRFA